MKLDSNASGVLTDIACSLCKGIQNENESPTLQLCLSCRALTTAVANNA